MTGRPNILWITTDQQRADTIAAMGNGVIRTPNLDRLAAEGVAFTRAYCQSAICTPSRSSFLTGLHPSTVHGDYNGNRQLSLPDGVQLITRRLADAGYHCGLAGKLHLASAHGHMEQRVDDGYEEICYSHSPWQGLDHNDYTHWLRDQGVFDQVIDTSRYNPATGDGARYQPDVPVEVHQTTWCCDRAAEFMQTHRGEPWLMSVNIFDPHPTYDAPASRVATVNQDALDLPEVSEAESAVQKKLEGLFFQDASCKPDETLRARIANYYAMVEIIDENVGRLLDALDCTGQAENTLVLFTSDHGHMLGEHGLENKGCRFYEELVRVPLIVRWPGTIAPGRRFDQPTPLLDLAPTLAELTGCEPGPTQGKSLRTLLIDNDPTGLSERVIRCEFYDTLDATFFKPDAPPHTPCYATMTLIGPHKIVVYHGREYGELYDLAADPDEKINLWDDPACQTLRDRLIHASFDQTVIQTALPPDRIGRY
jgi:arylsulfatase